MAEGATITGRIVRDGKPASAVVVGVAQPGGATEDYLGDRIEIATNDAGVFVLSNVAPSVPHVLYSALKTTSAGVIAPAPIAKVADASTIDLGTLPLEAGRSVSGTIKSAGGGAIPRGTEVELIEQVSGDYATAAVGEDGAFRFDRVPPGAARISVSIPGVATSRAAMMGRRPVEVPERGDVTGLVISVQ